NTIRNQARPKKRTCLTSVPRNKGGHVSYFSAICELRSGRIFGRKRDDIRVFGRSWREGHTLRLCDAMFTSQMAVGFHCQSTAVFVPKPAGNGRNIDARFNAPRGKQMSEIVVRNSMRSDFFARTIKRLLAFTHAEYFLV